MSRTALLTAIAGAVLAVGILATVTVTVISEDHGGARSTVLPVGPGPGVWVWPAPAPPRTIQPRELGPLPALPPGCPTITIGPDGMRITPTPGERNGPCRMQLLPRFRQR